MKIVIFSNSFWNLFNFRMPIINELKKNNKIILLAKKDSFYKKFFRIKNITPRQLNFSSKSVSILSNFFLLVDIFFFFKKRKT